MVNIDSAYLILLSVRIRIHCGIEQFCFNFLAKTRLILNVLWAAYKINKYFNELFAFWRAMIEINSNEFNKNRDRWIFTNHYDSFKWMKEDVTSFFVDWWPTYVLNRLRDGDDDRCQSKVGCGTIFSVRIIWIWRNIERMMGNNNFPFSIKFETSIN